VLPEPAQLALALVVALPVVMVVTRSWVRFGRLPRGGSAARDDDGPVVVASEYRLARWLTYLGFGTLALLTLRPTPALTLSDWIFLAALVVAVLGYLHESRGIHMAPPRLILAGVTMVLIGALLSLPNAVDGTESLAVVARFVYITVGWFALAGYALRTTRDVSIATNVWVASVALSGAAAVAQLLAGGSGRMLGFGQHYTDLGGMCAVAVIPAFFFLDIDRLHPAHRIASAALAALVLAGLLLSGSVDGFVSAAVGLAIWVWTRGVGRRSLATMLGLAALFVMVAGAAVQLGLVLPGARIASVLSGPDDPYATFYLRLQTFGQAWQWIGASPVFGAGFDTASATSSTVGLVHNVLIATWFQGGVLALMGIVLVLLAAARTAWRAWVGSKTREGQRLAAALLASVGSAIAFSMGNPILFQRYVWAPVFLAIALVGRQAPTRASVSQEEAAFGRGVGRATTSARSSS
jgi:O-antigen ligase